MARGGTDYMVVTAKELRARPGKIIAQVAGGVEIVVTVRGRRVAKIVPLDGEAEKAADWKSTRYAVPHDEIFGLWKDRDDLAVDDYVRRLRRGRSF